MLGGVQPSFKERGVEFDNVRPNFSEASAARGPNGTPSIDALVPTGGDSELPELVAEAVDLVARSLYPEPRYAELLRAAVQSIGSALPTPATTQPDFLKLLDKAAREKDSLRRSESATKVMRQILSSASEPDARKAVNAGLRRVLATFDREGTFFPRESLADFARSGEAGVGLSVLRQDAEYLVSPGADTPAERAGIEALDVVLKIDNAPPQEMEISEIQRRLKGEAGTEVRMTLRRGGADPFEVVLKRQAAPLAISALHEVGNGVYYLRLTEFSENAGYALSNALSLAGRHGMRGLVLDLRNNSGGLLDQVVRVAGQFLPKGTPLFSSAGRTKRDTWKYVSDFEQPFALPLAVLVNKGTSAGAEFVALALQKARRATIVGLPTRAKWTIQTIFPLRRGGAVSVTTARLLNVRGQPLDGNGLAPDAIVDLPRSGPTAHVTFGDPGSDLQLQRALETVTRSLERPETSTLETDSPHATSADPDPAGAPPGPARLTAADRSGRSRPSH
jgi:carboxyl-terminal processing protease